MAQTTFKPNCPSDSLSAGNLGAMKRFLIQLTLDAFLEMVAISEPVGLGEG
jgi:hypothetical protein